jgi:alpha-tubulin suppressor-like RCC1 family protein
MLTDSLATKQKYIKPDRQDYDDVSTVAAGNSFSLAVKKDGSMWVWGNNDYGQLCDGTITNKKAPVKITNNVSSVSAGCNHSLFIKTDGSLWACGWNYEGQLGDRTSEDRTKPIKMMDDVISATEAIHILLPLSRTAASGLGVIIHADNLATVQK